MKERVSEGVLTPKALGPYPKHGIAVREAAVLCHSLVVQVEDLGKGEDGALGVDSAQALIPQRHAELLHFHVLLQDDGYWTPGL